MSASQKLCASQWQQNNKLSFAHSQTHFSGLRCCENFAALPDSESSHWEMFGEKSRHGTSFSEATTAVEEDRNLGNSSMDRDLRFSDSFTLRDVWSDETVPTPVFLEPDSTAKLLPDTSCPVDVNDKIVRLLTDNEVYDLGCATIRELHRRLGHDLSSLHRKPKCGLGESGVGSNPSNNGPLGLYAPDGFRVESAAVIRPNLHCQEKRRRDLIHFVAETVDEEKLLASWLNPFITASSPEANITTSWISDASLNGNGGHLLMSVVFLSRCTSPEDPMMSETSKCEIRQSLVLRLLPVLHLHSNGAHFGGRRPNSLASSTSSIEADFQARRIPASTSMDNANLRFYRSPVTSPFQRSHSKSKPSDVVSSSAYTSCLHPPLLLQTSLGVSLSVQIVSDTVHVELTDSQFPSKSAVNLDVQNCTSTDPPLRNHFTLTSPRVVDHFPEQGTRVWSGQQQKWLSHHNVELALAESVLSPFLCAVLNGELCEDQFLQLNRQDDLFCRPGNLGNFGASNRAEQVAFSHDLPLTPPYPASYPSHQNLEKLPIHIFQCESDDYNLKRELSPNLVPSNQRCEVGESPLRSENIGHVIDRIHAAIVGMQSNDGHASIATIARKAPFFNDNKKCTACGAQINNSSKCHIPSPPDTTTPNMSNCRPPLNRRRTHKSRVPRFNSSAAPKRLSWGLREGERDRMIYVSWLPRVARAEDFLSKRKKELKIKEEVTKLGFQGLEKVLLYPPHSAHCKMLFDSEKAACVFLASFGGREGTVGPERWKQSVCRAFAVDIKNGIPGGIPATRVKVVWADASKEDCCSA